MSKIGLPKTDVRDALILSCSAAKRRPARDEKLPAIDLYAGPWWRVLRYRQPSVEVFALSGRFGLIPASTPLAWYDQKLPARPSDEWIKGLVLPTWHAHLRRFETVWVCVAGGGYAYTLDWLRVRHYVDREGAPRMRHVGEVLTDRPGSLHYFTRMKALSLWCKARRQNPEENPE